MHVVFPLMRLSKSGGVRVLVALANGLTTRGHRVSILVAPSSTVRRFPFPLDERVQVKRSTARSSVLGSLLWLIRSTPRNADVLVANFYLTAYPAAVAAGLWRPKGYYFIQDYEPHFFVSDAGKEAPSVQRVLATLSYRLPLCHITVSTWLQGILRRVTGRDAAVINDGVDCSVFSPSLGPRKQRGSSTIMCIGRKAPRKGLADLLEAIQILAGQVPNLRLMIATQDAELKVTPVVRTEIVSPADDEELARHYRSADVFVFTSLQEGFGLPPLEAMASGTPVVTTDCGGISDFAEHEVNCLVVPVGDSEAVAEATRRILCDHDLAERLSTAGRETACRFTWDVMVDSFERLLVQATP